MSDEELRAMLIHQPRPIALSLLLLGAIGTSAGDSAGALAMNDDPKRSPAAPQSPVAAKPGDAAPSPAPGRMFVVGRVLDAEGKPVPGAAVMAHARSLGPGSAPYYVSRFKLIPLGDARADGSGRFRIDAPRTSSSQHDWFAAVALAPGLGVGWVALDPDDDRPAAEILLRPEQVIHGRLFDLQGRPVPDVRVSVASIRSDLPQTRAGLHSRYVRRLPDGVFYWSRDANDFPAWPRPVTTDSEGRFTLRGVGRSLHVVLAVHHPRFAHQTIEIDTAAESESKTVTAALAPPQIVNVRVTYADTGQPVPHAPLGVLAAQARFAKVDESETDADGRARVSSFPTDRGYRVTAYPPEGQPYLTASGRVEWPKGALEQTLNIALTRGVPVHGKITEEGSGRPVPRALIEFVTRRGPAGQDLSMSVYAASDGSFHLGAEPKSGHLLVRGPDEGDVFQAIGSRIVLQGQPGGQRIYSHAYTALDLKPGMGSQEVNMVLRRGATVEGRVVGPDGQPVRDAWIFSRLILDPDRGAWRSWSGGYHGKLRNGRFEIRGLDPDTEVPVYFLEPERKLGAVVNFSGRSAAGGPVTVRLEPCGAARAWVVDPDGKPVAKPLRDLTVTMVVTPGPPYSALVDDKTGLLSADEGNLTTVDPINYENELAPDTGGRITLPVLIPGATYRFLDYTAAVRGQAGPEVRKEFTVKPSQKVDLGDIRVAKPPR
jgi:protocatechuate 3,4-dioxygenase beta subunit